MTPPDLRRASPNVRSVGDVEARHSPDGGVTFRRVVSVSPWPPNSVWLGFLSRSGRWES